MTNEDGSWGPAAASPTRFLQIGMITSPPSSSLRGAFYLSRKQHLSPLDEARKQAREDRLGTIIARPGKIYVI